MKKNTVNLFAQAVKNAPKQGVEKKDDKRRVKLHNEELKVAIDNHDSLKTQIDTLTMELAESDSLIKAEGKKVFLDIFKKEKKNPNSFIIDCDGSVIMYIPTDNYTKIDEERAEVLASKYGEDVIDEKVEYTFNKELLEQYQEVLSELISNSKKIKEEDKANLIKATVAYKVAKGTVDTLVSAANMDEMFDDLGVIVQLKRTK